MLGESRPVGLLSHNPCEIAFIKAFASRSWPSEPSSASSGVHLSDLRPPDAFVRMDARTAYSHRHVRPPEPSMLGVHSNHDGVAAPRPPFYARQSCPLTAIISRARARRDSVQMASSASLRPPRPFDRPLVRRHLPGGLNVEIACVAHARL